MTKKPSSPSQHRSWFSTLPWFQASQSTADLKKLCVQLCNDKVIRHEQMTKICRLIDLDQIRVKDVMIPRANMTLISIDQPVSEIRRLVADSGHSRFPVLDEEHRMVIGLVFAKDLVIHQQKKSIKHLLRKALFIPESKRLDNLLHEFQSKHQHMAIVVDEYGDHSGLITIEDVIEQITGDIEDEHDQPDDTDDIRTVDDQHFIVKASLAVEDFNTAFQTQLSRENTDTIGGIILGQLGYIPEKGTKLLLQGLQIEVYSANEKQILSLMITTNKPMQHH